MSDILYTTRSRPQRGGRRGKASRRAWRALSVVGLASILMALNSSALNTALPTVVRHFHAGNGTASWILLSYLLVSTVLTLVFGRCADLFGRRRMYLLGVVLFTVMSAACALAPNAVTLVIFRFAQGAGAAVMVPQIMSVIQVRFSGAARARALSAYTAVLSSGFVVGQVVGGALVTANLFGSGWRPVFLVNVPIGLAVLALAPRLVPRDVPSGQRRLDLRGLSIAVPAVFLVVLPLTLGHQERWPAWSFACVALGCALAVVFFRTERAVAAAGGDPLLRLSVLRSPGLRSGLGAIVLLMCPYGGFLFSFAIHLQAGLGYDPLRAGLVFAPCAVVFGLCGYFWRRRPARWYPFLTPAGCLAGAAGYAGVADRGAGVQLWVFHLTAIHEHEYPRLRRRQRSTDRERQHHREHDAADVDQLRRGFGLAGDRHLHSRPLSQQRSGNDSRHSRGIPDPRHHDHHLRHRVPRVAQRRRQRHKSAQSHSTHRLRSSRRARQPLKSPHH